MKFIYVILIALLVPSICVFGQNKKNKDIYDYPIPKSIEKSFKEQNEKLLYKGIRTCLLAYIQKRKEFIDAGIIKTSYRLTVSTDGFPPNFYFENIIEGVIINYISLNNYQSVKKELRKGIGVLSLSRVEINNDTLEIGIAYHDTQLLGDNHFNMAFVDSMTCVYKYSCEKQEWILMETKYGSV